MKLRTKVILILSKILSDNLFNFLVFKLKVGYFPNFKKPKSLNEKINFIKLYNKSKRMSLFADRLKVRNYVKEKAPNCYLIEILWEGYYFDKEVYDNLPEKFVLKANHGSGMVKIVNKKYNNYQELKQLCNYWQSIDYGAITRQHFYSEINRKIIVEELLDFKNDIPPDYKFFCFNGKVNFVQIDLDRFGNHSRLIYDQNFNKLNMQILYENNGKIKEPSLFNDSKLIAEKLSANIDFIRVDLYILDNKIIFGELTNTPGNGFEPIKPREKDFYYGSLFEVGV